MVYIELPQQDRKVRDNMKMRRLVKAIYGARDVPEIWVVEIRLDMNNLGDVPDRHVALGRRFLEHGLAVRVGVVVQRAECDSESTAATGGVCESGRRNLENLKAEHGMQKCGGGHTDHRIRVDPSSPQPLRGDTCPAPVDVVPDRGHRIGNKEGHTVL